MSKDFAEKNILVVDN